MEGGVSWCRGNGITAGVKENGRAREAVAVLSNDVGHIAVMDFE